jgi:nicotinate-nucleotide adenylyltransferase
VEARAGKTRVAIFGGSFNPPHVGHVLGVIYVLSMAPVDEVLIVPVYQHPFAKHLTPFAERMEMCRLALGWLPRVSLSAIEEELGGESLTLRTLEHLAATHPDWSLRLLVGADVLGDLPKWHRWDRISALAPPLVLSRNGVTMGSAPIQAREADIAWVGAAGEGAPDPVLPRVSSTEIRDALMAGDIEAVRGLVPAPVLDHIVARGLYGVRPG